MSFFSFELDPALAADPVFDLHKQGKMAIRSTVPLSSRDDLSLAYTPGVARVCEAIAEDPSLYPDYTWTANTVAVVTDGSAVLGLGNIGPKAAMPVMEGKAILFKQFGGVDSIPICLDTQDVDGIVAVVKALAPSFGGINLEDISAPRCFEIERRLDAALDIPVFHDDQHGTAVVVLAALRNAATLLGRRFGDLRVVISGAGAAGIAITHTLIAAGVTGANVIVCDSRGIIHADRGDLTPVKAELAATTNFSGRTGGVEEALIGADVLIGVSGGADRGERAGRDGTGRDHLRPGQPDARGAPRRSPTGTRRSSRPGAATSPTRSTTCWLSPASSAARSTAGPHHHRPDEGGGRRGDRRGRAGRTAPGGDRPVAARPAGRTGGGQGGGRGRGGRRGGPSHGRGGPPGGDDRPLSRRGDAGLTTHRARGKCGRRAVGDSSSRTRK